MELLRTNVLLDILRMEPLARAMVITIPRLVQCAITLLMVFMPVLWVGIGVEILVLVALK